MALEVRLLGETDERSSFQSGDEQLDLFSRRYAGQNQFRHHIGATYVAVESETICGFATVTVGPVEIENLPPSLQKKLPDYPLPMLRLAQLAVDRNAQGMGVGGAPYAHRVLGRDGTSQEAGLCRRRRRREAGS